MLVHIQVAARAEIEIEAAMTREKLQHVIEKANAGGDVVAALAIKREADADGCFRRFAFERCAAPFHENHPVEE
jgi:hypothetical protein